MFDLTLLRGSYEGHDAQSSDGRLVEIKLTQGDRVSFRSKPDHLIVLQRKKGDAIKVVYNGPGEPAFKRASARQKNGQHPISIKVLEELDRNISKIERLKQHRDPPI